MGQGLCSAGPVYSEKQNLAFEETDGVVRRKWNILQSSY